MPSSNDEFPPLSLGARFVFSEAIDLLLCLYAIYRVVLYLVARWWRPILRGVLEPRIDVSSNPRLRGDRTTGLLMECLHASHDADACILSNVRLQRPLRS